MKIFTSGKKGNDSRQNIGLEDYERKIEEREEGYHHLNEILHGMRSEVSNLMREIKRLSDEVEKKNAEKFLIEQKVDDLDRSYHLLQQVADYEQNTFLSLRNNLEKIKDEIKTDLSIQDELNEIKKEYDLISRQVAEKKLKLSKIEEEKFLPLINQKNESTKLNLKPSIQNKLKRCSAKTKNGPRCKRLEVESSGFCSIHRK